MSHPVPEKGRVAVLAFGTHGDVLPVAVVAAALAESKPNCEVIFITHAAHQFLKRPLASAGVLFRPISTAPVTLPPDDVGMGPGSTPGAGSKDHWRARIEQQHQEECLLAVEEVLGQYLHDGHKDFILFNFFALEGWHLAELYQVPCAVAAPYVVPYSAPASFERQFRTVHPLLYERLQLSEPGEVGWGEVMHWMWPLFTERWTEWRSQSLHLSSCPLTDPVTELPMSHNWPRAPPLLYGFSEAVVECPAYWPRSAHICGFWFARPQWEEMYDQPPQSTKVPHPVSDFGNNETDETAARVPLQRKLMDFLSQTTEANDMPIFIGLGSIGSMGYLTNPGAFLEGILKVLETLNRRAILCSASYPPLDSVILAASSKEDPLRTVSHIVDQQSGCEAPNILKDGIYLSNNLLFCFSGFVSYNWLFPKCSIIIHHGGSGTTAAALKSGVPQVICPFVLDQFYWAERMAWIGVAPQALKASHMCPPPGNVEALEAVTAVVNAVREASLSGMHERAAAWSQTICEEDGVKKFVQIVSAQLSL